jgi:hypothetical protein
MKKQRGQRRYYKKLTWESNSDVFSELNLAEPNSWPKNWHYHFDYKGYGNNNFKKRKPHLDQLFRYFDVLAKETKQIKADFQLYIVLLDYSSNDDALFFHKPNPGNSQFPFKIVDLRPTSTLLNKSLNNYIGQLSGFEKRYGCASQAFCLLFKKDVGKSFETESPNH